MPRVDILAVVAGYMVFILDKHSVFGFILLPAISNKTRGRNLLCTALWVERIYLSIFGLYIILDE